MSGKQDGSVEVPGSAAVTSTGSVEQESAPRAATANAADACNETGKRACSKSDPRLPLLCQDKQWHAQPMCSEAERCETAEGGQLGRCVPIASECLNHEPGDTFCDGDYLRSCDDDLVLTTPRECEARRRCMEISGTAQCVCARGWIDDGSGAGCAVPTSCMTNNGGCDPLSQCSLNGNQRVCSMCPPGFEGSGDTGCYAQLSNLEIDTGTLTPAFAPEIHSYRITLPLLRSSVQITPRVHEGVKLAFDSVDQTSGTWQSPALPFGEHKVVISLRTGTGLISTYEVLIERGGAQEAYLKAAHPDSDDEFGNSVALWGDTLAVGVYQEDSSGTRDQVDNTADGSGAVYIFVRNGGRWEQQDYLKAATPVSGDFFGYSVTLREDLLVVGAPGANAVASSPPHGGSVHVFKRQGSKWSFLNRIAPADSGVQDLFGNSVVVDDKRLIVGAPFENSSQTFSGAIYVFARTGDDFGQPQRVKATRPLASGLFGWSLAIDADTLIVGSPQYNFYSPSSTGSGMAYVFAANNTELTQLQELPPAASLEDGATFGWAVDVAGDRIAVGAPRARASNVGQGAGDAFIYERASGGAWGIKQGFRATVPRASDWYGYAVKLSAATLLVGSPGDASGSSGLMGDPNNDAAVDSGAMYMYGRNQNEWVDTGFIKASNPDNPDYFGSAIAVYADTIISTSPGEGSDAAGVDGNQASNALSMAGAAYVFR